MLKCRKSLGITMSFEKLGLIPALLKSINELGYKHPTEIQKRAIPIVMAKEDTFATALTGTGKTAAFVLPMLQRLRKKMPLEKFQVRALIITPTRELAEQIHEDVKNYGRYLEVSSALNVGGRSMNDQAKALEGGIDILISTPGRLIEHLSNKTINFEAVEFFVLDEADRMLDMGFIEEIQSVLEFAPKQRQTLLFSATYDDEIRNISKTFQDDAVSVKTTQVEVQNKIEEVFFETSNKLETLIKTFSTYNPENVIVFTNTKIEAKELADKLQKNKIDALAIHGDLEQYERNDVLVQFANKSCPILVATDVAARGIDIKELGMVVNYDLPHGSETYTHRIGRTGRAGADGIALTFYETYELEKVEEYKNASREFKSAETLKVKAGFEMKPQYVTLVVEGGKKDKLRAGDLLGALTGDAGLSGSDIGKIDIYDRQAYVAISRPLIKEAHAQLQKGKIKGKNFSVWIL